MKQSKPSFLYESAEEVEQAFYEAFSTGDVELMKTLYADDDVSSTHDSGPTIIGREKIIENWKFIFEGIPKVKVHRKVLNISKSKEVESTQVLESFAVDVLENIISEVYTTNIYIFFKKMVGVYKCNTHLHQ